jgi:hypothetical protein
MAATASSITQQHSCEAVLAAQAVGPAHQGC